MCGTLLFTAAILGIIYAVAGPDAFHVYTGAETRAAYASGIVFAGRG